MTNEPTFTAVQVIKRTKCLTVHVARHYSTLTLAVFNETTKHLNGGLLLLVERRTIDNSVWQMRGSTPDQVAAV